MRNFVPVALPLLLIGADALVPRVANPPRATCGNTDVLNLERSTYELNDRRQDTNTTGISVDVYFHIASSTAAPNLITDAIVDAQFAVLRDAFAARAIALTLVATDRVVDDATATGFYRADGTIGDNWDAYYAHLRAARRGGYDALNLFFYTNMTRGLSGVCSMPTAVTDGDEFFYRDGCQINGASMPGVPADYVLAGSELGHTAIHEVGHWFGLLHTFQGACGDGDGVADTPAQSEASWGCPVGSDTCPDKLGADPIHNYMDYSNDEW